MTTQPQPKHQPDAKPIGRPPGSKNAPRPTVDAPLTRCPQCGSTDRERVGNAVRQESAGLHQGQPYNLIVWRRTKCLSCGQFRTDREFLLTGKK
jgi:hypothetical protein